MLCNKNGINILKNTSLSHRYIIIHVKKQNQLKESNFQGKFYDWWLPDEYKELSKIHLKHSKNLSNILNLIIPDRYIIHCISLF